MTKEQELYHFKSQLDEANHYINQISRKTGLTLLPYIIKDDGFEVVGSFFVAEALGDASEAERHYRHYEYYNSEGCLRDSSPIHDAMRELSSLFSDREEMLPQFKLAWERVPDHGEGVMVHYGIRRAYIRVPLETVIKYDMFLQEGRHESIHFSISDDCITWGFPFTMSLRDILPHSEYGNEVWFSFCWSEYGNVAFDNRSDFLGWKISEYKKAQRQRSEFIEHSNRMRSFQSWERKVFSLPANLAAPF